MKFQNSIALSALVGLAAAEVPQEHSHEKYLRAVNALLKQDNPLNIQDAVFGLLGNAAAEAGAGDVTNLDCLHQATADSAFTAAKAANDVDGMASALVFRAVERNTGSVGLKSVLCDETAQNPEIAALTQHQDPASEGAAATNKEITLELARQLAAVGADPMLALDSGTFEPGDPNDNTGAGNTCDDADDAEGCIFSQNLLVQDATPEEIQAAVDGADGAASNSTAVTKLRLRRATLLNRRGKKNQDAAAGADASANATAVADKVRRGNKNKDAAADAGASANATAVADKFRRGNKNNANANGNAGNAAAANETADAAQSAGNGGNANANGNQNNNANGNNQNNADDAADATGNGNANNNNQNQNGNQNGNQNNNANNGNADDAADHVTDDAADDTADGNTGNNGNQDNQNGNQNQNGNNQNNQNGNQNNNGNANNGNADNANNGGNDAATGTDVQTFTGDLGGPPPPVTSDAASDKPFSVNGATFVNAGAALQRSCAVQHNACADAANSGSEDITVADCDAQEDDCLAAASLKKLRRSSSVGSEGRKMRIASNAIKTRQNLDFGECQDPSIEFAAGLDGRKEASFGPAGDFEHGSALNINIISSFICGQLSSRCQASDDAVAACEQGQADAQGLQGQAAADAFNTALGL
ncbi:Ribosomal protein s17 [Colletotrichum asianum]